MRGVVGTSGMAALLKRRHVGQDNSKKGLHL
jgi:hypothetical protein